MTLNVVLFGIFSPLLGAIFLRLRFLEDYFGHISLVETWVTLQVTQVIAADPVVALLSHWNRLYGALMSLVFRNRQTSWQKNVLLSVS